MTSDEMRTLYRTLADSLPDYGLKWVASQVEELILSGRPVEKTARILSDEESLFGDGPHTSRRRGKPTIMQTLEKWSDLDQLAFLLDGLRQAVIRAAELENEQLKLLRTIAPIEAIEFQPDQESDREPLMLKGIPDDRISALAALLDALEREVRA